MSKPLSIQRHSKGFNPDSRVVSYKDPWKQMGMLDNK